MATIQQARPLTPVQQRTLDAIKAYMAATGGISPSLRDLSASMGRSHTCIYEHVLALRDKGWITMGNNKRSIRIVGRCCQCGRMDEPVPTPEELELQRLADDGGRA